MFTHACILQLQGSGFVEGINDRFDATMTNIVRWREPALAQHKEITSDTTIQVVHICVAYDVKHSALLLFTQKQLNALHHVGCVGGARLVLLPARASHPVHWKPRTAAGAGHYGTAIPIAARTRLPAMGSGGLIPHTSGHGSAVTTQ